MHRLLTWSMIVMIVLAAAACSGGGSDDVTQKTGASTVTGSSTGSNAPTPSGPVRVLVITETAGFEHGVIPNAIDTLRTIDDGADDFELLFADDSAWTQRLADVEAVAFVLTSGELPLSPEGRQDLISFVEAGGGFVGIHSATDTFYEFPEYQRLIGSWLRDHPYSEGTLARRVADHPATVDLPEEIEVAEELYRFKTDPREQGMISLLELSDVEGAEAGEYLPSAWCGRPGTGRTIYSALGHFEDTWKAEWFRSHVEGAIGWAAGTRPSTACG